MKTSKYISFILAAATLSGSILVGCDSTGPRKSGAPAVSVASVARTGTVVFREKDGGFYGILTDNGGQYEPKNLDSKFCSDGLRVSFTGQLDTTQLGQHRWGNPVEIVNVSESK